MKSSYLFILKVIYIKITMFSYNESDSDVIISCHFDGINVADLDPNEIFSEGSTWADRKLLYETIKAYAAFTGWKPTLES